MKEKEKAKELVGKFTEDGLSNIDNSSELEAAKNHALICVDEIINALGIYAGIELIESKLPFTKETGNYWQSVKSEIEKL